MQRLTGNDVDFSWRECEQLALDKLKEAFCSAPILAYPDHEGEFIVDTDASNYAVSGARYCLRCKMIRNVSLCMDLKV